MTTDTGSVRAVALRDGWRVGLITGALWVVNLDLETYADLPAGILATAPFLLGAFVLWGAAAAWTTRRTGQVLAGSLVGQVLPAMLPRKA